MRTRKTTRNTQKIDCQNCGREYTPMCDYMQGRCPYHPAMLDMTTIKTRFINLINFFKGK
jgi:hypothetical protein